MGNKSVRNRVFEKYDGRCAYCGCELEKGWHVDHINPKVYQGTNEFGEFLMGILIGVIAVLIILVLLHALGSKIFAE